MFGRPVGWGQIKVPKGAKSEYRNQGSFSHDQVYHVGIRFNAITPDGILLLKAATENKNTVSLRI
jgi:hypothetical protein